MYKKVFLDANVIADIYDKNRPFNKYSDEVIEILFKDRNIELFTSCDIITTLYYILSKKNREEALKIIIEANEWCSAIEFSNKEIAECCSLMQCDSKYKDLEDTIQYVIAKR